MFGRVLLQVLDRGLFHMSSLFRQDTACWEDWRSARDQQEFLPQTLGERLVFCHPSPPAQLRIRLFSQSPHGKDVEVGSGLLRPTHLEDGTLQKTDEVWDRQMEVSLHGLRGDASTCTVTCLVDWNPEPIKPKLMKKLRVIVLAAQNLAAGGSFMESRNDPYVEIFVDGAQPVRARTTTAVDGGTAPCWGEPAGRGESFTFEFSQEDESKLPAVKMVCWDEDTNSRDDNLGEGEVQILPEMRPDHPWTCYDKVQVWNKKRKPAGEVHIVMQYWDPGTDDEPEYPELRRLRVTVFAAKGLPKMDTFGSNDPYAQVSVDGRCQRTSTVAGGGSVPSWQNGRGESLVWCIGADAFPDEPSSVTVVLFDEDQGSKDDVIGSASLVIGGDSDQPWSPLYRDEHLQLLDRKEKPAGTVHVLIQSWDPKSWKPGDAVLAKHTDDTLHEATVLDAHSPACVKVQWDDSSGSSTVLATDIGPRLPPMRLLRVTILRAQDLPKMDTFGATDPYVQIEVDGTIVRTSTAVDGGANACWGDGKGETFDFDCMTPPQRINVRCFDEDLDADDEIGKGRFEIAAGALPTEAWYREEMVTLRSRDKTRSRRKKSKILVAAQWFPLPPVPHRRIVDVTVLAAKELDSMDLGSANDVYAEVVVDTDTQRTTTIDDGGSDCEWNGGDGEMLSFDRTMAGIPAMQVKLWDFDIGSADDMIGDSGLLNLRDRAADESWTFDSWITLTRKGKRSGQVHVIITWCPDPPEPERRGIRATVLAARDLPKADLIGDNDVYTEITIGETALRTSVVDNGGSSPTWGEEGEIMEFYPCVTGIPVIRVKCFDQDIGSADDELGTAILNLKHHHSPVERWEKQDWFPLRKKSGKEAGSVHLRIAWDCEPPLPKRRGVRITIMAAKDLPKADLLGENDVYTQVSFGETVSRTSVVDGGGSEPSWGSDGEVLEVFPEICGIPTLEVKLFDEDVGSADDELGVATLNLRAHDAESCWTEEDWWPLKRNGKEAGAVRALIQWTAEPPLPKRRGVRITILAARDLPKADLLVRLQTFMSSHFVYSLSAD